MGQNNGSICLLDADGVATTVEALGAELAGWIRDAPDVRWALVGVQRGGVPLVSRLVANLAARGVPLPTVGSVDITFYRDDLYRGLDRSVLGETHLPLEVEGAGLVLVDDVLFTGRTVRAALGEVWDYGRPAFIRLITLVDRGGHELPIAADIVGLRLDTVPGDKVVVRWAGHEGAEADEVWLERR